MLTLQHMKDHLTFKRSWYIFLRSEQAYLVKKMEDAFSSVEKQARN